MHYQFTITRNAGHRHSNTSYIVYVFSPLSLYVVFVRGGMLVVEVSLVVLSRTMGRFCDLLQGGPHALFELTQSGCRI